ncbi:quercetin 2,3-dioxygenase [Terribacillus saccharophilus]|uniref:quercetin 2,3-dioxygenase n=1 Tax=Terribacillus saccharophilus TaxID=361277 RepID=UPI003982CA79
MSAIHQETTPRQKQAYLLRNSHGDYYLLNKQVIKILADASSTGNLFGLVQITGSKGESSPSHKHEDTHEAIFVTEGLLEVIINQKKHLLSTGDYAHIPAGTVHQYKMLRNRTRFYSFTTGGSIPNLYRDIAEPYDYSEPTSTGNHTVTAEKFDQLNYDISIVSDQQGPDAVLLSEPGVLPDSAIPYVVESGAGEGLLAADQLFTFLATQATTDKQFLSLVTEGYAGKPVPAHYHEHHTECFLCLEGKMTMWAAGQKFQLEKGDFLHVPANTEHSFQLDSPYTKFIGFLASGLFEQFFRLLGEPYKHSELPGEPSAFSFHRVLENIEELDLKFPQK